MNTCTICGKDVHTDDGYATDGKIFVCRKCAEVNSFRDITVRIANACIDSNIKYVREAPIEVESGLVDQTNEKPNVELDEEESKIPKAELYPAEEYETEIDADIENMSEEDFMSKYCDDGYAVGKWYDAHVVDYPVY